MCTTCGCSSEENVSATVIQLDAARPNGQYQDDLQSHTETDNKKLVALEVDILHKNNLLAERNRGYFQAKNILALNLVSSPGSGKTALLERTLNDLGAEIPFFVVEGDQQTTQDADRIAATGTPVVQINTGQGCHLDADMVNKALRKLNPTEGAVVMIENVGNLVCPAMFDLGESARVVIMSVTEGEDKPIKYPYMFHSAQVCLVNKVDLLPYLDFDLDKAKEYAQQINPRLRFIEISATKGQGMEQWYHWLKHALQHVRRGEDIHHYHHHQAEHGHSHS